jgi:hypothetical protein
MHFRSLVEAELRSEARENDVKASSNFESGLDHSL